MFKWYQKYRYTGSILHQRQKSKLFRILPFIIIAGLVLAVLYIWMEKGGDGIATSENVTSNQKEILSQTNGMDVVEISAQNPGQQLSKKESDSLMEAPRTGPDRIGRSTSSKNKNITPPTQRPKSRINNLVPANSKATIEDESEPDLADVSAVPKTIVTPGDIKGASEETSEDKKVDLHDIQNTPSEQKEDPTPSFKIEKVFIPASYISVLIPQDISSNKVEKDDIVYFNAQSPVESEGQIISRTNARVRARVIDAKASHQGSRAALGIRMEALETVDGQWLGLNYHDIVERRRDEIVFRGGTILDNVKIEPATINLKIFQ